MTRLLYVPALLLAAGLGAAPAAAQDNDGGGAPETAQDNEGYGAPEPIQGNGGGFTISGGVTATSDYRFRGLSQSNEDPALQADLSVDHESGFYAGLFVSTLSDDELPGAFELDAFVGYTREVTSGTSIDVGLQLYSFPDNQSPSPSDYFEPYAAVRHTLGPVTAEVGAAYAPEQEAIGDNDSLHVYTDLSAGIPFTPVTIVGRVGYTSGPAPLTAFGDYLDWRLGVQYVLGPARLSLEYVDTDLPSVPNADATLVASVRFGF